jgi:uncharacterized membrane protein YvbJ
MQDCETCLHQKQAGDMWPCSECCHAMPNQWEPKERSADASTEDV